MTQTTFDSGEPERRSSDDHTRKIVHLTVMEIFDGVGVDFTTPKGRERFRDNLAFLDDAASGTRIIRRTFWGALVAGAAMGIYKLVVAVLAVGARP